MLSVLAGIYRVGFTIFTSAIICKTGVSLFLRVNYFCKPDFFVISGFYLLQKRQVQRKAMLINHLSDTPKHITLNDQHTYHHKP
jgi:surface polysaccharide O-acyltransferase-like enzyme